MLFQTKNTLKSNRYYTHKHSLSLSFQSNLTEINFYFAADNNYQTWSYFLENY
jgi:hypothetical protein